MLDGEQRLKLSIQKGGRLGKKSEELLSSGGLKFEGYIDGKLFSTVKGFPLDIYFDRDDDIADNVESGITKLGMVGQNIVRESRASVVELMKLGFGNCALVVATPTDITSLDQLRGKTVATSYPNSSEDFFGERGISVKLLKRSGSIEGYALRGLGGIVDLTDSGNTLREAGLQRIADIYESEAVLIADPTLKDVKGSERIVRSLVRRILSVQRAEGKTYISLNAPSSSLNNIADRISGETSPTVSKLRRNGWLAISVVVPVAQLDQIVDDIQEFGAEKIVENGMKRLFPDKNDPEILEIMGKLYE